MEGAAAAKGGGDMNVWKFKKDTPAYKDFLHNFTYVDKWEENKKEILDLLGIEDFSTVVMDAHCLRLLEVPKHLEEQFEKSKIGRKAGRAIYAKQGSKINTAWVAFCKSHGLKEYNQWVWQNYLITSESDLKYGENVGIHRIGEDLFITCDGDGSGFNTKKWLEPFSSIEFSGLKEAWDNWK